MKNLKIFIATVTIASLIYFNYVLIEAFGLIGIAIAIGIIVIEIILMIFFILIKKHLDK